MSHISPEQTYIFPRSNSRWQFSRHPGFTRSQVSPGPQAPCHAISALGRVGVVQHPPELMVTVAQLVGHFSHQLPETPPPRPAQSPEQGRASETSVRNLLLSGGGTDKGGGRIPKGGLQGNALPACDPVGGGEQSKQPLPCPLCGCGQVHRPVWTAALSVRLFGRCWLIDGVGRRLTPWCLQRHMLTASLHGVRGSHRVVLAAPT